MNSQRLINWRLLPKMYFRSSCKTFACLSEIRMKQESGFTFMAPDLPSDTAENNHVLYLPKDEETPKYSLISPMKCLRSFVKNVILFEGEIDELEECIVQDTSMKKSFEDVYSKIEERLVYLDYSLALLRSLQMNNHSKYKFTDDDVNHIIKKRNLSINARFKSQALHKYMREFNSDITKLNKHQQRITEKYFSEGLLSGGSLTDSEAYKLKSLQDTLEKQMIKFSKNVAIASARFSSVIDDKGLLKHFPEDFLLAHGSTEKLVVKLKPNIYEPFMEYCGDSLHRWNVWRAYNSRASHVLDIKISNSMVVDEIRDSRKNIAKSLDFENYVDLVMKTKMAQSSDTVYSMINSLTEKTEKRFHQDVEALTEFVNKTELVKTDILEPWNIPYFKRQFLNTNYPVEANLVKQYFPFPVVLRGLFDFIRKMFNINIEEVQQGFDAWHSDVRLFRLISQKGFLGSFFVDAYSRPEDKIVTSPRVDFIISRHEALRIKPICNVVCNFQRPLSTKYPSLLSFEDVRLLFKAFGFVLQHIVNEMPHHEISGMNNLEWDRVYFCAEFMALWFQHDYRVVQSCSANVNDESPLPKEMFQNIRNAQLKFYSFHLREELYKAALDLALHSSDAFWKDVMQEMWQRYLTPFKLDTDNHHVCSFTDIFCGHSAGFYYSRKWAEMLAADAFLAFKEVEDCDDDMTKVGKRFMETVMSLGGGCNGKEVFRLFRGRDPSSDALLFVNNVFEQNLSREREGEKIHKRSVLDS